MESKKQERTGHSTEQELDFLQGLGTWSDQRFYTRIQLLQGYIRSCAKRRCWGKVDRLVVFAAANELLQAAIYEDKK